MAITLPGLPYDVDALAPHVSAETLRLHYGEHHKGYVEKLNKAIEGTKFEKLPLVDIVIHTRESADLDIFNNAAQAWNHEFLWQSMSPQGGGTPDGRIKDLIGKQFGNVENFRREFKDQATSLFGSGWTWLVMIDGELKILNTSNADTPLGTNATPLLVIDVWEHAYYLDHQNDRGKYVDTFLDRLINWDFAARNIDVARKAA